MTAYALMSQVTTERNGHMPIRAGSRVEIPSHTDYWMEGDRYGEVVRLTENSAGVVIAHVDMDRSGKRRRFRIDLLKVVN